MTWQIAGAREAAAGCRVRRSWPRWRRMCSLRRPASWRPSSRPGTPTVTVAMRTPYDLAAYPGAGTHLCSYAIVPASVGAVADALFGRQPLGGRLPVAIPGLYPRGHGMEVTRWA